MATEENRIMIRSSETIGEDYWPVPSGPDYCQWPRLWPGASPDWQARQAIQVETIRLFGPGDRDYCRAIDSESDYWPVPGRRDYWPRS